MANGCIEVLLVEDHEMVAQGLARAMLEDGLDVVGVAHDVAEAIALAREEQPDVVMMDYNLPDGDGADAARAVCAVSPRSHVVMLTAAVGSDVVERAVEAGCCGFVHKSASLEELTTAVHAAAAGDPYFTPDALTALVRLRSRPADPKPALSEREREVLQLVADGATVTEIAERLALSTHTVRNHLRRSMEHLGVHNRLEAVIAAARVGLVDLHTV